MNQPSDGEVLYEVEVPEEDDSSMLSGFRVVAKATQPSGIEVQFQNPTGKWFPCYTPSWLIVHLLTQLRDLEPLRKAAVELCAASDAQVEWHKTHGDLAPPKDIVDRVIEATDGIYEECDNYAGELAEKGQSDAK